MLAIAGVYGACIQAPVRYCCCEFRTLFQFSLHPIRQRREGRTAEIQTGAQDSVIDGHFFQPQTALF